MAKAQSSESSTVATGAAPSVDPKEVAKLSALMEDWWNPAGRFQPLHRLNPVRLGFIRDRAAARFGRDATAERPLEGLSVLDIGCGGGLLGEPLARLGAQVTGIDASEVNVGVAALHAKDGGLTIDYRHTSAEELAEAGASYDLVLNMEVVEHVADVAAFLEAAAALVAPGGAMALSTLNRTPKAFLLGIVGAEYLLRWLPRGTHDWRKFLRPSEVAGLLRPRGLDVAEITGVSYNPLAAAWRLSDDVEVNYMLFAVRD
ncbi:MAG: bifunctional 2-polyprenyl-6-hydroxyphenol methylase/3-demethylubiquinol 3-O-methyltransferase UbiG [Kiloniellales bacterium]